VCVSSTAVNYRKAFAGLSDRLTEFTVALTVDLLIILDAKRVFTDGMIGQLAG
jgi:hypothetical protein